MKTSKQRPIPVTPSESENDEYDDDEEMEYDDEEMEESMEQESSQAASID
jgi:hypothetical protein